MTLPRTANRRPLSDRICDVVCVAAALWTLCCHLVVALGGSLHHLLGITGVVALGAMAIVWRARRSHREATDKQGLSAAPEHASAPISLAASSRLRLAGIVVGVCTLVVYAISRDAIALWVGAVAALALGAIALLTQSRQAAPMEPPVRGRRRELALWALAFGCVVLTLICHRQDWDDSFYVNVAVAAADHPDRPILAHDTLHGVAGLAIYLPLYRVHSYEVFNGAVSYLTGIPAIYCFHWISAGAAALLVPLGLARLFRLLTPRHWLWAVAAVLIVLVAAGDVYRWYGNYAFVRMWCGKSIFLSVFMPLAYAYGMSFGRAPTAKCWLMLAAVQIASVGCTSSAIWAAPVAAILGVASAIRLDRQTVQRVGIAALSSAYVVILGLAFKGEMAAFVPPTAALSEPGMGLSVALTKVLGDGPLAICALAAVLLTWTLYRTGPARRFAIVVPLIALVALMNPFLETDVARHIVGSTFWRIMWALPIPILLGLALIAPLQLQPAQRARVPARVITSIAVVLFALLVPRQSTLSRENGNLLATPHAKVRWGAYYKWATDLHDSAPPNSYVVAPWLVSLWLPTIHDQVYPLLARCDHYFQPLLATRGSEDLDSRRFMHDVVTSSHDLHAVYRQDRIGPIANRFREGLDDYQVDAVCVSTDATHFDEVRRALVSSGFELRKARRQVETWVRVDPSGLQVAATDAAQRD